MRLKGRVALVTGAAMGIGKGIALLFAQQGARVIAADVNAQAGTATAEEIRATGAQCIFQRTDVSVEAEVKTAIAAGQKEFGHSVDVLANVAGIAHESPAHLLDLADFLLNLATGFLVLSFDLQVRIIDESSGLLLQLTFCFVKLSCALVLCTILHHSSFPNRG